MCPALVDTDAFANHVRFPDHDAGPVVKNRLFENARARTDVDAGDAMLRYYCRDAT